MEVEIKEIKTGDNKLNEQELFFGSPLLATGNDGEDYSFKKSLSAQLACSLWNIPDNHSQSSPMKQCKMMQNYSSVPLNEIKEKKLPSTMINDDLPTSTLISTNDVNKEMNDDDPVSSDTTFSTPIITILPQLQPTTFTLSHNDFLDQNLAQSDNNTSAISNVLGSKNLKSNQWIKSTEDIKDEQSDRANKKNNYNLKHMLYAATANNLVFAYGRGKKCRNTLNGITIKVPVGTM